MQPSTLEGGAPAVIKPVPIASDRELEAARQTYLGGEIEQAWNQLLPVLDRLDPENASQWETSWIARIALDSSHFHEAEGWIDNLAPSWLSRFDRLWLQEGEGPFDMAEAVALSADPQWGDQELSDRKRLAEWLWQRQDQVAPEILLAVAPLIPETVATLDETWPTAERLPLWAQSMDRLATPEEAALLAPLLLRRATALGDRTTLGLLRGVWHRAVAVATSEEYAMAGQAIEQGTPKTLILRVPPRSEWEAAAIEAKGMSQPGGASLEWDGESSFPDRTLCSGALCEGASADAVNLDPLAQAVNQPWVAAAQRLSRQHPGAGVVLMLPKEEEGSGQQSLAPLLAQLRQARIPVEGWYRFDATQQDPGKVVDDIPIAVPRFPDREVEDRFRTRHPLVEGAGIVLMASHDVAKLLVPKLRFSSIELPVLGIGDWDQLSLDPSDRDAFEGVAFLLPGRDPQEAISGTVGQVVRRAVVGALIQGWQPEIPGWQDWEVPGQGKIELSGSGVRLPYQVFRFKDLKPRAEGTLQMETTDVPAGS